MKICKFLVAIIVAFQLSACATTGLTGIEEISSEAKEARANTAYIFKPYGEINGRTTLIKKGKIIESVVGGEAMSLPLVQGRNSFSFIENEHLLQPGKLVIENPDGKPKYFIIVYEASSLGLMVVTNMYLVELNQKNYLNFVKNGQRPKNDMTPRKIGTPF